MLAQAPVQRINDMAAQIATACEEQSCVTEEIARNITDIRDLSNEAATYSSQGKLASQQLSGLAKTLADLVGRFRRDRVVLQRPPHQPAKPLAAGSRSRPQEKHQQQIRRLDRGPNAASTICD